MIKNIAFVHRPHFAKSARLETMPFALNAISALADSGWVVHVYLWEDEPDRYRALLPENVTFLSLKAFGEHEVGRMSEPSRFNRFRKARVLWEIKKQPKYFLAIGLGQIGVYIAALLAKSSNCPLMYFNDEFPSTWQGSIWTRLEQESARIAASIVVPDQERLSPLCRELGIENSASNAVLPNTINADLPHENIDWHERLKIPKNADLFLNAGSIVDWAQIPELLGSVAYWPVNSILIIHSRSKISGRYRKELSHLDLANRVFWTDAPLEESELNSLVAYCSGSFALYRNTGPNIEFIGTSSGKIMRSIYCGTPVIATNYHSLRFIEEHRLGVLVKHPSEFPDAVKEINNDLAAYRDRCYGFSATQPSFGDLWLLFCKKIQRERGIDLQNSIH